jgi:hypothetical protein
MKNPILFSALISLALTCGCGRPKDFDVNAVEPSDPNGLKLNPKWGQQTRSGEENVLPDPYASCPVTSYTTPLDPFFVYSTDDWTKSPQFPNCTSVPVTFNGGSLCGPHVNFENVTYEGTVTWDIHGFDDDYDLNVRRDDSALYTTTSHQVHIEFDSDETVDNWDDTRTWWNDFHHNAVDHVTYQGHNQQPIYDGDAYASAMINGSYVIVIGELGLDCWHSAKAELHPVYAMFVHLLNSDFSRSSWAFFVRNWGDEGYCSDGDQPLETPGYKIKVMIPNVAGLISDNVSKGAQNDNDLSPMQAEMQPYGDGVLMVFTLLPPDKQSWYVGDLTFVARPPKSTTTVTPAPANRDTQKPLATHESEEGLSPELKAIEERLAALPPDSRIELDHELRNLIPRKKPSATRLTVLLDPATDEDVHPGPLKLVIPGRHSRPSGDKPTQTSHRQMKLDFIRHYLAAKDTKTTK